MCAICAPKMARFVHQVCAENYANKKAARRKSQAAQRKTELSPGLMFRPLFSLFFHICANQVAEVFLYVLLCFQVFNQVGFCPSVRVETETPYIVLDVSRLRFIHFFSHVSRRPFFAFLDVLPLLC